MELVFFDDNINMAEKIKRQLGRVCEELIFCNSIVVFLEYLRNYILNENVVVIASEKNFQKYGMSVDYFMNSYDLCLPIFTYYCDDTITRIKLNYLARYRKFYGESYIATLSLVKNVFEVLAEQDNMPLLNVYSFSENELIYDNEIEETSSQSLFGKNIESKTENNMSVFSCLTKTQMKLVKYLLDHRDGASIQELAYGIWGADPENKAKNIYTMVSIVRGILEKSQDCRYQIVNINKGYRLVRKDID